MKYKLLFVRITHEPVELFRSVISGKAVIIRDPEAIEILVRGILIVNDNCKIVLEEQNDDKYNYYYLDFDKISTDADTFFYIEKADTFMPDIEKDLRDYLFKQGRL